MVHGISGLILDSTNHPLCPMVRVVLTANDHQPRRQQPRNEKYALKAFKLIETLYTTSLRTETARGLLVSASASVLVGLEFDLPRPREHIQNTKQTESNESRHCANSVVALQDHGRYKAPSTKLHTKIPTQFNQGRIRHAEAPGQPLREGPQYFKWILLKVL